MSDRTSMYMAIKSNPLDDTARLVFADYLDDQDNRADSNQAQFIRAQIELNQIGPRPITISSIIRGHGPNYWSALLSDYDDDIEVGSRVDLEEEYRHSARGKPKKPNRKFHRLRVVKIEIDDPVLNTRRVYLTKDDHATPWPEDRVKMLTEMCAEYIRTTDPRPCEGLFGVMQDNIKLVYHRGFISKVVASLPVSEIGYPIAVYPITEVEFIDVPTLVVQDMGPRLKAKLYILSLGVNADLSVDNAMHENLVLAILKKSFPQVPKWVLRDNVHIIWRRSLG